MEEPNATQSASPPESSALLAKESGVHRIFGINAPFASLLRVHGEQFGNGHASISLECRPELANHFGMVHGGVLVTLLDMAMAIAARSSGDYTGGMITIDMSVQFLRPGSGRLVAEGQVLRSGRQIIRCESFVKDEQGEMIAKAHGSFMPRRSNTTRQVDAT